MTRYLFMTWNGAGNQWPALGLAQAIRARGDTIFWVGAESQRSFFEPAGFGFSAFAEPPPEPKQSPLERHRAASWINRGHAILLGEADFTDRFDVLVIDCLMFGALAGAEALGLPAAVLIHSAPNALVPAGKGLELSLLDPLNALRRDLGLAPLASLQDAWRPFLNICPSIAELDPPGATGLADVNYVGPIFTEEQSADWLSPWPVEDPRPLVVVSFSTGRAWDQTSRVRAAILALSQAPLRALITTKDADAFLSEQTDAIRVVKQAPHLSVLKLASATITHCGHGTLAASLACGVPLVCMPNAGADQEALSLRVEQLGVGAALDGNGFDQKAIRTALDKILSDGRYAAEAADLAQGIRSLPGAPGAIELLRRLSDQPAD